jgi:ATP-dependent exoDNAse (exonuclease V) alpha subunit
MVAMAIYHFSAKVISRAAGSSALAAAAYRSASRLSSKDVLVIDEAGMIGTRQMERVICEAEKRGAKVVLVGDVEQLQAIEAGAAFRSITERHGSAEITTVRRQREGWQPAVMRPHFGRSYLCL